MATDKKYWKGLGEINNEVSTEELASREFAQDLPTAEFLGNDDLESTSTSRRDFLKFMGFSTAAATLAACEAPIQKSIPYVVKPEESIPGVPSYYASTFNDGYDFAHVLVKTREGRPIKIEGNEMSPFGNGTNARVQGAVLSLYDKNRVQFPMLGSDQITWGDVDGGIGNEIKRRAERGEEIAILTTSLNSPSRRALIEEFAAMYPTVKVYEYDAVSYSAILDANNAIFGKRAVPMMHLDKAEVIVGVNADFLGEWLNVGNEASYIANRDPRKGKMSRHIQFETNMTLTGANADKRVRIKPSEQGALLVDIYNAVASKTGNAKLPGGGSAHADIAAKVADELVAKRGKSVVLAGNNNEDIQKVAIGINMMLNAYDMILDHKQSMVAKRGDDKAVNQLIGDMKAGKVGALLVNNVNPVYSLPNGADFKAALENVGLKVYFTLTADESAEGMDYILPLNHFLESWADGEAVEGVYSLTQPTINPLFDTRHFEDSLLAWMGKEPNYYNYLRKNWESTVLTNSLTATWNTVLHDGIFAPVFASEFTMPAMADLSASARAASSMKGGQMELELYTKAGIGDGRGANNPWLQELPDPITRASWDNYLTVSRADAEAMGLVNENVSNGALNGSYVKLTVNGVSLENVPVMIQPGQANGTVGLALGYGRTQAGKAADGVGVNAYALYNGMNTSQMDVTIEKMDGMHEFACIQLAHTMMGRSIVKETTLADFIKDPKSGNPDIEFETIEGKTPVSQVDLWQDFDKTTGHWWNLSIDLNSCIGCGACVVACQAENNTPVVGKEEIRKSRDMYWLRIDRYYSSDMNEDRAEEEGKGAIDMYLEMEDPSADPEVVFQPVMCQHCNHAPCETVCPVGATAHSAEGLNHMAYNRCIGTRYCANNCPYKVRRFNWFNYAGNDMFAEVNPSMDDLGRMVLNPDVTVRARGVMEKCSMCIQRTQLGKLQAKREGRPIVDGEFTTACAGACSTNAIVFGDINDKKSQVAQLLEEPRAYHLLEEVGTKPSVFYHTKVRNKA